MASPNLPRTARKALLWGLATFLALQLGLVVAIDNWVPSFRDPWYGPKVGRLQRRLGNSWPAEQQTGQAKLVLMFGSSFTGNGLNGAQLEARLTQELGGRFIVYNFGVPGAGPLVEMINFERLLAAGIRPDLVLIEVFPPWLSGEGSAESYRLPPERLEFKDIGRLEKCHYGVEELRRDFWESWVIPCYAHRYGILNTLLPTFLPGPIRQDWGWGCDNWGWRPAPQPLAESRQWVLDTIRRGFQPALRNFRLGGPPCEAIQQVLQDCHREHVLSALILMPEAAPFRSWYPRTAWEQIDAFLDVQQREHGTAIINARQWVPDEEFTDYHHMMIRGANLFTGQLGQELVRLLRDAGGSGERGSEEEAQARDNP